MRDLASMLGPQMEVEALRSKRKLGVWWHILEGGCKTYSQPVSWSVYLFAAMTSIHALSM